MKENVTKADLIQAAAGFVSDLNLDPKKFNFEKELKKLAIKLQSNFSDWLACDIKTEFLEFIGRANHAASCTILKKYAQEMAGPRAARFKSLGDAITAREKMNAENIKLCKALEKVSYNLGILFCIDYEMFHFAKFSKDGEHISHVTPAQAREFAAIPENQQPKMFVYF